MEGRGGPPPSHDQKPGTHDDSAPILAPNRGAANVVVQAPPSAKARAAVQKNQKKKAKKCNLPPSALHVLFAALVVATYDLLTVTAAVIFILVKVPKAPDFEVVRISETNITMYVANPDTFAAISYRRESEETTLSYQGKTVASGDMPAFKVGAAGLLPLGDGYETSFQIPFDEGSKAPLAAFLDERLKGPKDLVPLALAAEFPVKTAANVPLVNIKIPLRMRQLRLDCEVTMRKMRTSSEKRLLSHECKAKYR